MKSEFICYKECDKRQPAKTVPFLVPNCIACNHIDNCKICCTLTNCPNKSC